MKKAYRRLQIGGFVFTAVMGVLLHFVYDWTNQNVFAAPFSAVNESIWEHMKLLFFPMFVFALFEHKKIGKDYKSFWCNKLFSVVIGLLLIPVLYYTYTGALGFSADWLNISIFFIAAAASYSFSYVLFLHRQKRGKTAKGAFVLLCLLAGVFVLLTFLPPKIPLFADPSTKEYGIQNSADR